jgi:ABC-2 type transport system ATP-binding protein
VPGADHGWTHGLPGATVLRSEGSRVVIRLDSPGDDQRVLQAALGAGPVREFAHRRPPLTELFRHVVGSES